MKFHPLSPPSPNTATVAVSKVDDWRAASSADDSFMASSNVTADALRAHGSQVHGQYPQSPSSQGTESARTTRQLVTALFDCHTWHHHRLASTAEPIGVIAPTCQHELSGLNHQPCRPSRCGSRPISFGFAPNFHSTR